MRTLLLALALWLPTALAEPCLYQNPVIDGEFPDPTVIRVGHDYYAMATAAEWEPLFSIAQSADLVHWRFVGAVFDERPQWSTGSYWAPELVEHAGRFYVYYTARSRQGPLCVAVAIAERVTGPYRDHGPLVCQEAGSIDAAHFVDAEGRRYLLWKEDGNSRRLPTPIWLQRLDTDGTTLVGAARELIRNDARWEGKVVEGPYLLQRAGWYYLFYSGGNCCGEWCDYALGVARARSLEGPWEKDPRNPILSGTDEFRCPGHGTLVSDEEGRVFLLYHAYSARDFLRGGRFALLDEVVWGEDAWPSINHAQGPTVLADRPRSAGPADRAHVDRFGSGALDAGWQWPIGRRPQIGFDPADGGWLELRAPQGSADATAVLGYRSPPGIYSATALIDLSRLAQGSTAGLGVYASDAQSLRLVADGSRLQLWSRERNVDLLLASVAVAAPRLELRLVRTPEAGFRFAYRPDGGDWRPIITAGGVDAVHKPNALTRIALFATGSAAPGARFGYVRIERW